MILIKTTNLYSYIPVDKKVLRHIATVFVLYM
jgi:hypothetical protein